MYTDAADFISRCEKLAHQVIYEWELYLMVFNGFSLKYLI